MDLLKIFKTRWNKIPGTFDGYRLACNQPTCSLSCANLKNGKVSVTSIHGADRHSYEFSKSEMAVATIFFLNNLSEKELQTIVNVYNKIAPNMVLTLGKIEET